MEKKYRKINFKILITMLVLFAITSIAVSALTFLNLSGVYEKNFTERVLISNNMMASFIDGDEVRRYVEFLRDKDAGFKRRQARFYYDREELFSLMEKGAPQEEQNAVLAQMESFHREINYLKTYDYWRTLEKIKRLKEVSRSKYVYIIADTGVLADDGTKLYTYIFDAKDTEIYDSPDIDGLGTVTNSTGKDILAEIYATKKPMDMGIYDNKEPYGELYLTYAPVIDSRGEVVAILGTDLELSAMHQEISRSMVLFSAIFLAFMIIIILVIYVFISRSVTTPLTELIGTAQKLAAGDTYASVPPTALNQKSELGVLAHVINDMGGVYQRLTINRAILDSNPFTCIIFDKDLNIIDCNTKALDYYRFNSKEELSKNFVAFLKSTIPEYQPCGRKSEHFDERIKTAFEKGYCEFDTSLSYLGTPKAFSTILKPIEYNGSPAVVAYQFDITAQKEIQQALKYRSDLLQAISDVAKILLAAQPENFEMTLYNAFNIIGRAAVVDRVYVWKNHTGEDGKLYVSQLHEWSPHAEPQQGNDLTVNILYDDVAPSWKEMLPNGKCINSLVKDLSKEEQDQLSPQGIVSILIAPILIQNKFWGFIGFDDCQKERLFSDVEENILRICGYMIMAIDDAIKNEVAVKLMAAKEEALMVARQKSNFLANMSHEIRTPMNAILGMTELILIEETSGAVLNHAIDIKNACRNLLAIINDVLDISKIESGKLEIIPTRYQVSSLLVDVISIIKIKTEDKKIVFIVNIDAKLPSELYGDEVRIRQILINLLNNAVKFTPKGCITLAVSGEPADDGDLMMKFAVTDTGIGIAKENMENIFEMFHQVDTKKNRDIEGTGLGLSISRQLAEMMGGFIDVESKYDAGSIFTAVIKQKITNEQPMAVLKNPQRNSVLIYENRNVYLHSLTYALDNLGCQYKICVNQSELYDRLDECRYDYIFASSLHVLKVRDVAAKKQPDAIIMGVLGESDMHPGDGISSISMPIHSLQVATILNGEYENAINKPNVNGSDCSMTAPDAKVLVVDDNIVNLKVAAGLLKAYEIEADLAISGTRALEMVKKTSYDLIFMDHMMPEMDGIDTTIAIRKIGGAYAKAPIIALTANVISGAKEMFIAEGLNDYLAKPIEISKLKAILIKWLPPEKLLIKVINAKKGEPVSLEIAGLDTQIGMERSGGTLESYLDILSLYASDSAKRLKEIEEFYEQGNLTLLTTYAHALKSASANIGAQTVASMAAGLEFAGKNGDSAYIAQNIKSFAETLSDVLFHIGGYLSDNYKKTSLGRQTGNTEFLRESIIKISISMENIDIDTAEDVLGELFLYDWDETVLLALNEMKDCLRVFDYDGVENVCARIRTICGVS